MIQILRRAGFLLPTMAALALGCSSNEDDGRLGTGGTGSGTGGEVGTGGLDSGGGPSDGGTVGSGAATATGGNTSSGGGSSAGGNTSGGANAGGTGSGAASGSGGSIGAVGGTAGTGGSTASGGASGQLPQTMVFLLLGQSNMVGNPQAQAEDKTEDPRIQVLAYDNCPNLGRTYDEWYTASPPLHTCDGGVGPGDSFAKTLLPALPEGTTIGLVPLAVNGAPLDVFRKGVPRPGWTLPPDDHWPTGYEWIIDRATRAQQFGTISGILFHQGESDADNAQWPAQVAQLVADLRSDLGLGESTPFIAGELLASGCCADRNDLINDFATAIPNAWVASSSGLSGTDIYHFDLAGQRELGKRYAEQMKTALGL